MTTKPSLETLHQWRSLAEAIAAEGAALILSGFRTGTAVTKKGPTDLVTAYDLECERLIRDRLATALPNHRIVGEETDPQGEGELVWFVDPIDGTTNFAHGHPFFCVSIGLFQAGVPLIGVVAAPALAVCWSAHAGGGGTRNGVALRVAEHVSLADSLCATGFAYDRWQAIDDNLAEHHRFVKTARGVHRCGSAALDLALTADGTYDLYWEQNLKPWDTAAGMVLVQEAGGRVTDYLGQPTRPEVGQVVASNGLVHAEALATIAEARRLAGLPAGGVRR